MTTEEEERRIEDSDGNGDSCVGLIVPSPLFKQGK